MMNNIRLGLAAVSLISALAVTPAIAADESQVEQNDNASRELVELNRQRARQANQAAVDEATQSVMAATKLDLDIRLISHITVAARK